MRIERSVAAFALTISILGAFLTAATVSASSDRQATREYASTHGVVTDLVITSGASPDVFYDL
jgi:hypothetical protein